MLVLLMRHGDAVEGPLDGHDSHRWLTGQGRLNVSRVARVLRERQVRLSRILSSPKVRAVQTAELVAQGAGASVEVCIHPPLAGAGTREALAPIEGEEIPGAVLLVGHMPLIGAMSFQLADRRETSAHGTVFTPAMIHAHDLAMPDRFGPAWIIDPARC